VRLEHEPPREPVRDDIQGDSADQFRARAQRVVDFTAQLAPDDEVHGRQRDHDDGRHRSGDGERESGAEAHGVAGRRA
jgi:hypothetical protein